MTRLTFSPIDCASVISVLDPNFEDKLIALGIDTDGKNGVVTLSSINTITSLDVSNSSITDLTGIQGFTALKTLNISGNLFKRIDISKNAFLTTLNVSNNPTLTCIQVADLTVAANWATTKDDIASFNLDCEVYTLIPDSKFEEKLIALKIDRDGLNGKVKTASISGITDLYISFSSISDLTGIQDFTSLKQLVVDNNKITTADFSKNTKLTYLNIYRNQLTTIDLSKNIALTSLDCFSNKLTSLDVTKNTLLVSLSCYTNQLKNLDLTKNTALSKFYCNDNNLTSVNLKNGKNTLLTNKNINLTSNPVLTCITVDDVTYSNSNWADKKDANSNYTLYDCSAVTSIPNAAFEDKLISLGIDTDGKNGLVVNSSISSLTTLNISNSSITNLTGIEGFTALKNLNVSGNILKKLDLSKNTALTTLDCSNNASLTCIQVADVAIATNNWTTTKDAIASFNLDCGYFTPIPDPNFEAKLIAMKVDDVVDGKVFTENIATVTTLNVSNSSITDLTGIQNFVSLKTLECSSNKITTLDLSKNIALEKLNCNWNDLKILDLSKNIALKEIDCYSNKLTALNVTNAPLLINLTASYNEISSIDVSNNKSLIALYLTYNKLSNIDLSQNAVLTKFTCFGNNLTTLDLSKNIALTSLSCGFNNFKEIDLSKNVELKSLSIENSYSIEKLDLSKNIHLEELYCYTSSFKYINLKNGNNTLLTSEKVKFKDNSKLSCIQVDDITYSNTNWTQKDATTSFNTECTYSLPSNNFIIETKGESCLGENNGEINIVATATQNYIATINDKPYSLVNKSLKMSNLTPGTYTVSITIPGEIFEQNYILVIAKGATITGKSSISSKKVNVEITDGTAPYTVFVNGIEQFETTDSNFSIELNQDGLIEVATAKACEGIYAKKVKIADVLETVLSAYPNPTNGIFEIEITTNKNEIKIELYNIAGQLISQETYSVQNGKAQLNLANQSAGIYAAKIYLETPEYLKIIKK